VIAVLLTVLGCGPNTERTLLTQFFAASRLRDLTALRSISTVVFEPASDGIVTSFEILGMTAVQGPDGLPVSEGVTISAPVQLPDGRTVGKTLVATLERRQADGDPRRGWMVTAINEPAASPSTPRP
jgi:hypothetical protein